jgi:hypothetical protein
MGLPGRRACLTERWRRLHESLTLIPDHRGVTTTDSPRPTPLTHPARAARAAFVTVAAASAAVLLVAGCGSAERSLRPAAAPGVPAPLASTTSSAPSSSTPAGGGAATSTADTDQSLADIDRALADLDSQMTDADRDVATPEGDLR